MGPQDCRRHSAIFQKTRSTAICTAELGLGGRAHGQPPDRRREHVQQERVLTERRSGLGEQGVHQERRRLQPEHGDHHLLRVLAVGRVVVQRHEAAAVHPQGRRDVHQGIAHDQDRLYLRPAAGERLRSAGLRRPRGIRLQADRRARRHEFRGGRRQLLRLVPSRLLQLGPDRNDSLSSAGVSVLRVLRAGRLAC